MSFIAWRTRLSAKGPSSTRIRNQYCTTEGDLKRVASLDDCKLLATNGGRIGEMSIAPLRSAFLRAFSSAKLELMITLSTYGLPSCQYSGLRTNTLCWPGVKEMNLNGPVPTGCGFRWAWGVPFWMTHC